MKQALPAAAILVALGALWWFWPRAARDERPAADTTFRIHATTYPLAYLASRIVGDLATVTCLVREGDPLLWRPTRKDIEVLQAAGLIVLNGAGVERWVGTVSLPGARTIDTTAAVRDDLIEIEKALAHSHGPGGAHTHEGTDPHTWLDPVLLTQQAKAILHGLLRFLPEHRAALEQRFGELALALDGLDRSFRRLGRLPPGESLFASHPAYDYLARRYRWRIVNFDLDPAEAVSPQALARIEEALQQTRARFMLWESKPIAAAAQAVAALGLENLVFSPCELLSDEDRRAGLDFLSVMQSNVASLRPAFERHR